MSPQCNTRHRPRWKLHRNSRKQDLPLSRTCRCTWSRCLGKKEMQSPSYPCNYPSGQLQLGKNKVTCKKTVRITGNDSVKQTRGKPYPDQRGCVCMCLFVPCGSASTRAKTGTCSVSHSFLTISLLLTSGTPLPWQAHKHTWSTFICHFIRSYPFISIFPMMPCSSSWPTGAWWQDAYSYDDAWKQSGTEVIVQESLESCIFLHYQDEFCRWYNVFVMLRNLRDHQSYCKINRELQTFMFFLTLSLSLFHFMEKAH